MKINRLFLLAAVLLIAAASCAHAGYYRDGDYIADPGEAKMAEAGSSVLVGGFVTASFGDYDVFVIESDDRISAITVSPLPEEALNIGDGVIVSGTVQDDGMLVMDGLAVTGEINILDPLALSNREIVGLIGNPGLAARDLLVSTAGKVLDVPSVFPDGSTRFHIADGTALPGGPMALVREEENVPPRAVNGSAIQVAIPPSVVVVYEVNVGETVAVTGIVGRGLTVEGRLCSVIIRGSDDLTNLGGSSIKTGGIDKSTANFLNRDGLLSILTSLLAVPPARFFPVVVIAADNAGDYGPGTPGTTTAGWQEALNYCASFPVSSPDSYDIWVKGGRNDGAEAVFSIANTIFIPAMQDFRIDGGSYTLNWTGATSNSDMIVVDSQMDARFTFDKMIHNGGWAAIKFRPRNPVPIDGFPVLIDSEFRVNSITGPGNVSYAVIWETSSASIQHNDFYFGDISAFGTAVDTWAGGSAMAYNRIRVNHLHATMADTWLLRVKAQNFQNKFEIGSIACDNGALRVIGVEINGVRNDFDIGVRGGFDPSANAIKLLSSAARNQINLLVPSGVTDWRGLVTDSAADNSNEVTSTCGPLPMSTQTIPTGTYDYDQRLYPAVVRAVGGTVSSLRLYRGSSYISYETSEPRESIHLSVGDRLQVTSSEAPTLHIIPIKVDM